MESGIKRLTALLAQHVNASLSMHEKDAECEAYYGHTGQLNGATIKFRKAKITPKKIGQFVTLWKRNTEQITTPHHIMDPFAFYIIATQQEEQWGYFIFPSEILGKKHILTTPNKEGKRGFRVYPDWDSPTNKQALQTQQWQHLYFIDCTNPTPQILEKAKSILQQL